MFIIIFTIIILALVTTKLNAAPQPTDIVLNDIVPPNILKAMRISDEKAHDHNVSDTNDDVDDEETKRTCATRAFVALLNLADDFNKKATSQGSHLQMRLQAANDDTDTITISYEDPDSSQ